jgi:hypothetical protein
MLGGLGKVTDDDMAPSLTSEPQLLMNTRLILSLILATIALPAVGQEAPELQRLRGNYDSAVQRAVRPLTDAYAKELARLRDTYMRSNRLNDAVQVDEEIKLVTQKLGSMVGAAPSTTGHRSVVLETKATIPANSAGGFKIGAVRQGDVITLQYVEGLWKGHGGIASDNPDDQLKDDESRLAIARGPVKDKPGDVIAIVPGDTTKKAYSFTFPTTREDVVLRIHKNSDNKKNPGSVVYQVTLMR